MKSCNCTLPYFNPNACKGCSNNTYEPYKDYTYVTPVYPVKKIVETWEGNKHIIEEFDGYQTIKKTVEEFDEKGKLIKRTTEETIKYPEITYLYTSTHTKTDAVGTDQCKATTSTYYLKEGDNISYTAPLVSW